MSRLSFPSLDKGGGSVLPVRNQIKIAWKKLKGLKRFDEFNDKLISAQIWSLQTPIYTPFFQCRKQYTVATSGHFPAEKNTCDLLFLVWSHTFQSSVLLWEFRTEIGLWDNVAFLGVRKRKCDFIWKIMWSWGTQLKRQFDFMKNVKKERFEIIKSGVEITRWKCTNCSIRWISNLEIRKTQDAKRGRKM